MKKRESTARTGKATLRQPTQSRSRESTEALLEIGGHLIEQRGVDHCSMNEVAAAAGSSVGALYFRFGNKERFVSEVMQRQADNARGRLSNFLAEIEAKATSPSEVIEALTKWLVIEFGRNRGLLRAQIRRALDRPQEWQPFQNIGRELVEGAIRIIEQFPGVQQDNEWQRRLRIAMQMILGTLHNAVINRPGPLELTDNATSHELSQAAIHYLRWDELPQAKLAGTISADVAIKAAMPRTGKKATFDGKHSSTKKIGT
ncbi:TetR/AcrR family transcriptional regulator [Bradyrhizobium sp.]|jgi:AcrR family transcriptional regulator|uniref:TetR/AcrR family transcriptional regulator n=1 Tax=Bradyrhizobium sp. TaxID=376 RepID=UPI003C75730E